MPQPADRLKIASILGRVFEIFNQRGLFFSFSIALASVVCSLISLALLFIFFVPYYANSLAFLALILLPVPVIAISGVLSGVGVVAGLTFQTLAGHPAAFDDLTGGWLKNVLLTLVFASLTFPILYIFSLFDYWPYADALSMEYFLKIAVSFLAYAGYMWLFGLWAATDLTRRVEGSGLRAAQSRALALTSGRRLKITGLLMAAGLILALFLGLVHKAAVWAGMTNNRYMFALILIAAAPGLSFLGIMNGVFYFELRGLEENRPGSTG